MKEWLYLMIFMITVIICCTAIEITDKIINKNQTDYIQQLEQSLEEQIQEKEVYMNMLEQEGEQ